MIAIHQPAQNMITDQRIQQAIKNIAPSKTDGAQDTSTHQP
jgi:hypothetical protein